MSKKNSYITVTDQFCGAGGSSQGAQKAGAEVKLALNHWKLAIETHNTNFPKTMHECTDISACDPRRYPSTDILITSPECTNHSLAKGQKQVKNQMDMFDKKILDPAAERSRATMWDVCRFAEYHQYNSIIVENVVDARKWIMWEAWLNAMNALGYNHKCVYLNSMHAHPTPQSRDRMYVVFWKKGNKAPDLEYMPLAHCPKCSKNVNAIQTWKNTYKQFGKYKQQYVYCCPNDGTIVEPYYYAAFNCIDWSDKGQRIGDRKKPLVPNTMKRIDFGLKKYGSETLIINDQHSTGIGCRVKSVNEYVGAILTQPHLKVVMPFIIKGEHTMAEDGGYVKSTAEPFQTQTKRQSVAVVIPYIIEMNKTGEAKPATEATATITAGGINHAVLHAPFIVESKGQSKARSITSALATQTAKDYLGIISNDSWNSFIQYNRRQSPTHITDPVQTVATVEQVSITNFQEPKIEDCYYRMLKSHEIKLAMAFNSDYVVLGSSKDQVKQLGNAVTPPAMEWLVNQVVKSFN